jgi:O-acetylserine/cysteine efflux transporter
MRSNDALLLIFIAFIWGFNFVVIRWGLNSFPPLLFSGLRFSVCALPIAFGVSRPKISWSSLILLGVTLGMLVFGLLYLGIYAGLNAGMASAVMQAQVFFTLALSFLVLGERLTRASAVAVAVGFSGLLLTFLRGGAHVQATVGFILVLLGAFSWGVSNVVIKSLPKVRMLNLMVWISLVPPLPLFLLSYLFEGHGAMFKLIAHMQWSGAFAILYTSALSTILAYGIWGSMLQRYSAALVSPFALLIPVFGLTGATIFLGTTLTVPDLFGPALIIAALILNWIGNAPFASSKPVSVGDAPQQNAATTYRSSRSNTEH